MHKRFITRTFVKFCPTYNKTLGFIFYKFLCIGFVFVVSESICFGSVMQVKTRLTLTSNLFVFLYIQKKQVSHELTLLETQNSLY